MGNMIHVETERDDKNFKDIVSAIDNATHALPGVSLTSAAIHNQVHLTVRRSEHQWAAKCHACRMELICVVWGKR